MNRTLRPTPASVLILAAAKLATGCQDHRNLAGAFFVAAGEACARLQSSRKTGQRAMPEKPRRLEDDRFAADRSLRQRLHRHRDPCSRWRSLRPATKQTQNRPT
ncbi:hypothetical protein, partial [Pseudomonas chlororaphis]|uniref:hypothetical protein n=1 Tax=Pseudomonas chlororaphis TaxID=587753 RepID=UPI001F243939